MVVELCSNSGQTEPYCRQFIFEGSQIVACSVYVIPWSELLGRVGAI